MGLLQLRDVTEILDVGQAVGSGLGRVVDLFEDGRFGLHATPNIMFAAPG